MARGKQTCKILKEIRRQIAEANDIEFITSECRFQGDCLGTCPKCEAEVRYLEQQLRARQFMGKAVEVAGLSAGMIAFPGYSHTPDQTSDDSSKLSGKDSTLAKNKRAFDENLIFGMSPELSPVFPGGEGKLLSFISENLHYPDSAECVEGKVIVRFTIDKTGKVQNPEIVRSKLPEPFNQEALRVVRLLPKFVPGKYLGEPIDMLYVVPITFKQSK